MLEAYFEEELSLKLVMEQNGRSLSSCAEEAEAMMRDTDRNREAAELFQSLFRVYQQHNGSLTNYGTSIETCFGTDEQQKNSRVRCAAAYGLCQSGMGKRYTWKSFTEF